MRNMMFAWVLMVASAQADPATLAAVNAARASGGRAALVYDMRLEAAARAHGQDMAARGFFSHTGSDGSDIGDRLRRAGYAFCFGAENIAAGQRSLGEVMASWMGSRGHRNNILDRKAQAVGVARAAGNRWVMVLAAPCQGAFSENRKTGRKLCQFPPRKGRPFTQTAETARSSPIMIVGKTASHMFSASA